MTGDTTLNLALGIIFLLVNRFWGNANAKKNAFDIKLETSSAKQVARLETRVMGLQNQMTAVNKALKIIVPPDDRGPQPEGEDS